MLCGPFTSTELTSRCDGLGFTANVFSNAKHDGLAQRFLHQEKMVCNYCSCTSEVTGSLWARM